MEKTLRSHSACQTWKANRVGKPCISISCGSNSPCSFSQIPKSKAIKFGNLFSPGTCNSFGIAFSESSIKPGDAITSTRLSQVDSIFSVKALSQKTGVSATLKSSWPGWGEFNMSKYCWYLSVVKEALNVFLIAETM